jgi:hypothetical protein
MKQHLQIITLLALPLLIMSCAPTVRLSTPDPVKIDVAMKVDVYTHEEKSSGTNSSGGEEKTPQEERRDRMAEVQSLKNDRIIGEGKDGYLKIKNTPTDPVYADYTQRIISSENADRLILFEEDAKAKDKPTEVIAREFSKRAREASFPGEWVEKNDGTWVEK